ncbi:MAG: DJ-1/PfpI family protein [Clostridia bacterium]|nr:DJ-1/PfpI family protein [Clostridia bacterium]
MIYVLLADGFEEIEALAPVDILRRAGKTVKTVGITGAAVCGAHGISVQADILSEEANERIDLLILPGGMPGATNLDQSPAVDKLLNKAIEDGAHIGAICAAPFILGKRGLLQGKEAICYPGFEDELLGACVCSDKRVVTSGKFTTAVGMGAACEFGLALLAALGEQEKATEIAEAAFLSMPNALACREQ